jgi:RimJ/RimL family protein N-acetyltransferase
VTVVLRPLERGDLAALRSWVPDEDALVRFAGNYFSWPLDDPQLDVHVASAGPRRLVLAALDGDGAFVGHATLTVQPGGVGHLGGIIVDPGRRGEGLGRALVGALVQRGFGELGLHRLQLWVDPGNAAAIASYEAAGFVGEGVARESVATSRGRRDSMLMGLLRDD